MSRLLIPHRPLFTYDGRLNHAHPLASAVHAAFRFDLGEGVIREMVTGAVSGVLNGAFIGLNARGGFIHRAPGSTASASRVFRMPVNTNIGAWNFSIYAHITEFGPNADLNILEVASASGSGGTRLFQQNWSPSIRRFRVQRRWSGGGATTDNVNISNGSLRLLASCMGGEVTWYRDGIAFQTVSTVPHANDLAGMSQVDVSVAYPEFLRAVVLFNRPLTADEAWRVSDDDDLLEKAPPRRRAYTAAAGDGITGTLLQTLDGASLSAGGALAIEGEAALGLDGATVAATGELPIEGQAAATLGGASLGATGELPIEGQAAATLEGATLAATGDVGKENSGEVNVTLDGASAQAQGTLAIEGQLGVTLGGATAEGQGKLAIEGTAAISLGGVTLTATGGEKEPEPEHPPPPGGGDSRKRRRKLRRPKYAYEIEEERKRRILVTAEKRRRREEEARKAAETPAEAPQRQEPVARLADLPQAAELARLAQVLKARTGALPPVEIAELEDAKARAEARRAAETRRFNEARRRRAEIAEAKRLEEDEEAALILLLAA